MTIIERVLLLQGLDFFAYVTVEQLSFLAAISREITAQPNRPVYKEHDPPDGLYVVISGLIVVRRGGEVMDKIGPNGAFGVWALFDDEQRLTSAEPLEESHLLFVPREEFYEVLSDHVDIVQKIFKHLVQRVRRLAALAEA